MSLLSGLPLILSAKFSGLAHGDNALLISDSQVIDLEGPLWAAVVPLLDGQRTMAEVVRELRSRFTTPEIIEALGALAREGLVESITAPSVEHAASIAARKAIRIHRAGAGFEILIAALADQGVIVETPADSATLELELVDDYLALNSAVRKDRTCPWLPVKLAGDVAWFGPIFRPGIGACSRCLEHRLRLTRDAQILARANGLKLSLNPDAAAAAQLCSIQVARWLDQPSDLRHPLASHLVTVNAETLQVDLHPVIQRPQCAACGRGSLASAEPLHLDPEGAEPDCGTIIRSDEAFLERYSHHLDELTGLVGALTPVAEDPVHVHRARYVRPLPANTPRGVIENRRLVAAGKGTTALAARTGALAEALERYSCSFDGTEVLRIASLSALGDEAVHPNISMLFSDRQIERGSEGSGIKLHVPSPFTVDDPIGWLPAWSLSRGAWRYVAAGWALMGYRGPGAAFAVGDSNGNAAGHSLKDAIVRGVGEVIERDAAALWWYNRVRRPAVNLDCLDADYLGRLRDHYHSIDREFWVLDITSDIGVPTFAAISRRTGRHPATPVVAFGSHLDARTAALRALTEMNQMLPHALARAPREDRAPFDGERDDSMALSSLDEHSYLLPDPSREETRLDGFTTPAAASLAQQINWIRGQLEKSELELIVLNLTRPDVGLPVVRVIVPGARHFWRRLAPGRLYDVPVQMGWCAEAISEDQVNPLELAI